MKKNKLTTLNVLQIVSTIIAIVNGVVSIIKNSVDMGTYSLYYGLFISFALISMLTLSIGIFQEKSKNKKLNEKVERIKQDLYDDRANSDIIINTILDAEHKQPIILNSEDIRIDVLWHDKEMDYDIKYKWILCGISQKNTLDVITLLIGGDSPVEHSDLNLITKIKVGSEWKTVPTEIHGSKKIKKIVIKLGRYALRKNTPFEILCEYIWKKSFIYNNDNVFSFGKNLYCDNGTPDIKIHIRANKKCIDYAKLHIRATDIDNNQVTDNYMDLNIYENKKGYSDIDIQAPNSNDNKLYTYYVEIPNAKISNGTS